jgi:Ni/Fe-hydrogenase subunit HybB-like protein
MDRTSPADRRRLAASAAALVFGLAAPLTYLLHRLHAAAQGGEAAALVLRQTHVAFYWRSATATWLATVVAGLAYAFLLRRDRADQVARLIRRVALIVVVAVAIAYWRVP